MRQAKGRDPVPSSDGTAWLSAFEAAENVTTRGDCLPCGVSQLLCVESNMSLFYLSAVYLGYLLSAVYLGYLSHCAHVIYSSQFARRSTSEQLDYILSAEYTYVECFERVGQSEPCG